MNSPLFRLNQVTRAYRQGRGLLHVLKGVDLVIEPGEMVALIGPSGAGKSTLLHVAGLLERPDGGEIECGGELCGRLSDDRRTELRRRWMGFVYQYHHLLPEFSALENVVLPQLIRGQRRAAARERATALLQDLGLGGRLEHRPGQLSGGEQQRVAIARALANRPQILLADEPTGNLDPRTAQDVFDLLVHLARAAGLAALVATHNPGLALQMDRRVELRDGRLAAA